MSLVMTVAIALKALRRNAMRTALTALGIIIGVAAVIVMVAIGTGARTSIENQIKSVGSNVVIVSVGFLRVFRFRNDSMTWPNPDRRSTATYSFGM